MCLTFVATGINIKFQLNIILLAFQAGDKLTKTFLTFRCFLHLQSKTFSCLKG